MLSLSSSGTYMDIHGYTFPKSHVYEPLTRYGLEMQEWFEELKGRGSLKLKKSQSLYKENNFISI